MTKEEFITKFLLVALRKSYYDEADEIVAAAESAWEKIQHALLYKPS